MTAISQTMVSELGLQCSNIANGYFWAVLFGVVNDKITEEITHYLQIVLFW